ncbi:MAG: hypothetical protein PHT54_05060, partial [Candidatus Nanoarchaeia archaeon]|nr:hypothetical protein [Candidatus Nanoarchaeia archaeon]
QEEIIEILEFKKEDAFEMEEKGFFFMPNKITYIKKTDSIENILNNLTKNKRKKVKKAINKSEGIEIIKERPLKEESFKEWFKLYIENLENKKYPKILATSDWWEKDLNDCEKIGLFLKKDNKIISGIVARSKEKDLLPRRMSISFSATKEEFKDTGLYDYLNVLAITFANEIGYEHIERGKDTNLYGKHLSTGIPIFKTSLGFEIKAVKDKPDILIKFNSIDEFEDKIFFVSYSGSDRLIGNLIVKDFNNIEDYKFDFLEKLKVFRYENKKLVLIEN